MLVAIVGQLQADGCVIPLAKEYRQGSHVKNKIEYHFVWVTKYRYQILLDFRLVSFKSAYLK